MSKSCEKCGRVMPDGGLAYEVKIQVYADFDGVLPEGEAEGDLTERLRALVAQMEAAAPERLSRDVYHAERHLLCRECRDRYVANPLNLPLPESLP